MRWSSRGVEALLATALGLLVFAGAGAGVAQEAKPPAQGQAVPEVEGLTVVGGLAPVPKVGDGAPQFSAAELSRIARQARMDNNYYAREAAVIDDCYVEAYGAQAPDVRIEGFQDAHEASQRLSAFAQSAQYAAQDALTARRNFVLGTTTQAQLEASELERQKQVRRVMTAQAEVAEGKAKAIDAQELSREKMPINSWWGIIQQRSAERARNDYAWSPVPKQFADLALENVKAETRSDKEMGTVIHVTGLIRNTRPKRIAVPPLAVSAVDEDGFALKSDTATARGRIDAGASIPFAYDLAPVPPRAKTVAVTFGDPRRQAWLLPAAADPVCLPPAPPELDPGRGGNVRRRVNPRAFFR